MDRAPQLSPLERRSLRNLAFALDQFEPFVERIVPDRMLTRLLDEGLAEKGPSRRPAVGSTGYRLTSSGWDTVRKVWNWG